MKIAVNARFLLSNRLEGLGRFTDETLRALTAAHPEAEFHFFFDRPFDRRFVYGPNVVPHVLHPQARRPVLYLIWFEVTVAAFLRRIRPDVFFSPDGYLSLGSATPQVPVFHDLAFERFPKDIDVFHRWHYQTFFPKFARKATEILTVSQFTKQDVVDFYQISPAKITVVGNGCSANFAPVSEAEKLAIRQKFSDGQPFFLSVGAIQPRKNIPNLLRAFDLFKSQTGSAARLLLAGREAWKTHEAMQTYENLRHKTDVRFTGFVSDAELNGLYAASEALCYVSRFEGFGIPILEAFHAETAVIASQTSSMPEVGGQAALYIDPEKVEQIAEAMKKIENDSAFRSALIEKGRAQRERFSWAQTAEKCWQALERAAGG